VRSAFGVGAGAGVGGGRGVGAGGRAAAGDESADGRADGGERGAAGLAGAERRHPTVVFCDLVESPALSKRLDAEDLRDLCMAESVGPPVCA
jgi:class 3 adenylate cyclase